MNKQLAMKILGLGPKASARDARAAFRSLAKSCHPDRFARDPLRAGQAEERMKQINAAFHFVLPLLPRIGEARCGGPVKQGGESEAVPGKKAWWARLMGRGQKARPRKPQPVPRPPAMRPVKKQAGDAARQSPVRFDAVLKKAGAGHPLQPPRTGPLPSAYANYQKYMGLKKQIRRSRSGNMGVSRIEKVAPVSRVSSVGQDDD